MPIVAASLSASSNEWDPSIVPAMEASDVRAIEAVIAEGYGVHDSERILARKHAGLQVLLRAREAGASVDTLLEMVARGGPPWTA